MNDRGTHAFIRKIMALPFLPVAEIRGMFTQLQSTASTPKLEQLTQYVGRTWITGKTWPPSSWSVFMKSIRTNNDIEGWHLGLNRRASGKSQLPLYLLIERLSMTFTANGKRQNGNFCRLSSALCAEELKYLYLQWIVRDTILFLYDLYKDYKKRIEN